MEDLQNSGISKFVTTPKTAPKNIFNEPNTLSGRQILGKTFLGLIIGGVIAALLFVILTFVGGIFISALGQATASGLSSKPNPLLPLILLFIGFLSTFIGNMAVAGLYSLFYSKKYYDISKTFGLLLLTNGLLFFILAPIYLVFNKQIETLFLVLGFHVLFSVFISACQIEFSSNPNYSGSALMGNVIGFAAALLIYSVIYNMGGAGNSQQQIYLLMLLPSILGYTLTPFGASIREKIYYKFYEMGNNAFYISSPGETLQSYAENDKGGSDEINIE